MLNTFDILGLAGVSLMIYSYARVQWRREYAKRLSYSLFNLAGSALLIVSIIHNWNLASFVSNAIWLLVSAYGIYRCMGYMRRKKRR